MPVNVSDNRGTLCEAENSRLPGLRDDVSDNSDWLCDDKCGLHTMFTWQTLCDSENSWLPVDVEYMETLRDD